ncbi:MAG: FISUMP domain-containing protein [Bacteroidales bacterium]|nr:FISUMP domain-containing protein [Bacteroidales bacterium]
MHTKNFLPTLSLLILVIAISVFSCKKEPKPKPDDDEPLMGIECPGFPIVYDADSNAYQTVLIGEQCWMRTNLNIGVYVESTYLGEPHTNVTSDSIIEKYCFKNDTNFCIVYGGLYDWDEMMTYSITEGAKGICPAGWHIPTDGDWKELELTLGLSPTMVDSTGYRGFYQGQKLLKNSETNFDAMYAGYRFLNGQFSHENYYASFWSSSLRNDSTAWYRGITIDNPQIHRESFGRQRAYSVRCIKN